MNDPNGFCFYNGRYHLFYQHNPDKPKWGRMHWAHASSEDMLRWTHHEIALKPDCEWDSFLGCFSGSALQYGGQLCLMYTGVSVRGQFQMLAKSDDGVNFIKDSVPVIGPGNLPPKGRALEFRDPKLFSRDGRFFALIGASQRGFLNKAGRIVLYSSSDLHSWRYESTIISDRRTLPGIFECPDYIRVDGSDIIIASPMNWPKTGDHEFENLHSTVYWAGALDTSQAVFTHAGGYRDCRELDGGSDFYAAQTTCAPDGRALLVAWAQMWKRSMPTQAEGWAGCMSLPRELSFRDGKLYQQPLRELQKYRCDEITGKDIVLNRNMSLEGFDGLHCDIEMRINPEACSQFAIRFFMSPCGNYYAELRYERLRGLIVLDRSRCRLKPRSLARREGQCDIRTTRLTSAETARLDLRLVLDRSIAEIFVNGGEHTMTTLVYNDETDDRIELFCDGKSRVESFHACSILPDGDKR